MTEVGYRDPNLNKEVPLLNVWAHGDYLAIDDLSPDLSHLPKLFKRTAACIPEIVVRHLAFDACLSEEFGYSSFYAKQT